MNGRPYFSGGPHAGAVTRFFPVSVILGGAPVLGASDRVSFGLSRSSLLLAGPGSSWPFPYDMGASWSPNSAAPICGPLPPGNQVFLLCPGLGCPGCCNLLFASVAYNVVPTGGGWPLSATMLSGVGLLKSLLLFETLLFLLKIMPVLYGLFYSYVFR